MTKFYQRSLNLAPWLVPGLLMLGWMAFCIGRGIMIAPQAGAMVRYALGITGIALLGVAWFFRDKYLDTINRILQRHTDAIENLDSSHVGMWVLLACAVSLFMELAIIRWHASCFQLFAYYKNVSLLSCFLGLGIGYALGPRRPLFTPAVLPLFAMQFIGMHLLRFRAIATYLNNPVPDNVTMGLAGASNSGLLLTAYGFMVLVFTFNALCFVPLGHLIARLMERTGKLVAYSWNLIGSLLGIGLFSLLSALWAPPAIWILFGAMGTMAFLRPIRETLVLSVVCILATLAILATLTRMDAVDKYSPYQIITYRASKGIPALQVNHVYFQRILDLSPAAVALQAKKKDSAAYYEFPYEFKPAPSRVLVVGSGTGNDVAAALRRKAQHVDAVEIDPVILRYGKILHPEKPYDSTNVTAIVDDARNFIRRTENRYDLIVYGLLDSHSLLSGMSSVRLDSFVYTVEAFSEARKKLKPDGIMSLSFVYLTPQHGKKLYLMLKEAFDGIEPLAYHTLYDGALTFVIGEGLASHEPIRKGQFQEITSRFADTDIIADVSTDDWPFFYLPTRRFPVGYLTMVMVLLSCSVLIIRQFLPGLKGTFSYPCFFLGVGFMLVEIKSITELAVTFGNTWFVISAVITGILIMAFLANLIVLRLGAPSLLITYGLLLVALILGLSSTSVLLSGIPAWMEKIVMTGILTLPLFFSGFAFSSEIARASKISTALSSNLLGAMVGGFLEYNAMYMGFRSLYFMAMIVYLFAYLSSRFAR